ncbi:putative GNAT family N-acetyltransferase [Xylariaceae sp. AK1471]|nr:putative GNAT family N-acetyltransferase [Xylariaceae sp. AK1471]
MATCNLAAGYVLVEGYPSIEDYLHLRTASGLSPKTPEQASAAIKGSWHGAYVAEEATPTKAIAMGRVVGDGGWYFLIADMATLPEHQRKGLGDAILKILLAKIKSHAAEGMAYVALGADPPGRKLYLKNGFKETMPEVVGMSLQMEIVGQGQ